MILIAHQNRVGEPVAAFERFIAGEIREELQRQRTGGFQGGAFRAGLIELRRAVVDVEEVPGHSRAPRIYGGSARYSQALAARVEASDTAL
nr:hypothetical protein [Methylobacterium longum]